MVSQKISELEIVEQELFSQLELSEGNLKEILLYLVKTGGKRLRPAFVILSGKCSDNNSKKTRKIINTSVIVEIIHLASLIHDDIIDNAEIRRDNETINKRWGNSISVLTGDFLFAKAFKLLNRYELNNEMNILVEVIQHMCEGQTEEAMRGFDINTTENAYYDIINKKTAKLFGACCELGSLISGANNTQTQAFKEFGTNFGYAYQIMDDIMDYISNRNLTGKAKRQDFKKGTITLPLIKLLEKKKYRNRIKKHLFKKHFSLQIDQEILNMMTESKTLSYSHEKALEYRETAIKSLDYIPNGRNKEILKSITNTFIPDSYILKDSLTK